MLTRGKEDTQPSRAHDADGLHCVCCSGGTTSKVGKTVPVIGRRGVPPTDLGSPQTYADIINATNHDLGVLYQAYKMFRLSEDPTRQPNRGEQTEYRQCLTKKRVRSYVWVSKIF